MASIKRRESGYQVQIRRKGFPQISKAFTSLKDAEAWGRLIESEMDRGIFQDRTEAERNTLGDILQRYMEEISPRKKSGALEAIRIKRFLRVENLCQYKACSLTGKLLSAWRDRRLKEVSGSTVNRELNLISHAINIARKEWGIHISNPIELIQRPRENRARQRRLLPGEELKLIAALDESTRDGDGKFKTGTGNHWIKPVILFAVETADAVREKLVGGTVEGCRIMSVLRDTDYRGKVIPSVGMKCGFLEVPLCRMAARRR